jgi:hypothetical protein
VRRNRYPDARDIGYRDKGYPFARPFAQSIADTVLPLGNAPGRGFSIVLG